MTTTKQQSMKSAAQVIEGLGVVSGVDLTESPAMVAYELRELAEMLEDAARVIEEGRGTEDLFAALALRVKALG